MEKEKAPSITDVVPDKKDNISRSVKKVDDLFQTVQEFIDKYRQLVLESEKFIIGLTFIVGMFLSWVFSSCTSSIIILFSHKILIGIVITLATLLLISTKVVPLTFIAMIIVSIILGLAFGEVAIAWDSNTYKVVTNGICENPLKTRDFLSYVLGASSGVLYIGKRYKLF